MRVRIACVSVLMAVLGLAPVVTADDQPLLLQRPTLGTSDIVFVYGGYLWTVARSGGDARQLTTGGHETTPYFSPDGKWIAFTGQYDGNVDVFVMPAQGGAPKRLTWHPGDDVVVGWTPDSKRIVFRSGREAYADFNRLYTIPVDGGVPEALPMWRGQSGSYSPDGLRYAYVPNMTWQNAWKRYRGGQTTPIYLVRLSNLALEKLPRQNSNDSSPVWFEDTVYFLSDRNGPVTLFAYNTKSKVVTQVVENTGFDLKSVAAGPDGLVYEQFGGIFLFDPRTGRSSKVNIRVRGDLPATRPHYEKVADKILAAALSPTGARAAFEARGEIVSVPADKGDVRNLTRTTGVAERDPAWSPDGRWIAYFSDESGEYALHLVDQSGFGEVKKINLGNPPSFFYGPTWSPDSKKIAYTDKRLNLWYVETDKGTPVKVDTDLYDAWATFFEPAWSPDSRWIAYSKFLPNHLRAIRVYSLDTRKSTQITDGIGDARHPVFDRAGKLLYFAASTDVGLGGSWLDLTSIQIPITRNVYAVVLKQGDANPVEPQSDEEKVAKPDDKDKTDKAKDADKSKAGDKEGEKKEEGPPTVAIDFDGIGQRIVALPIKAANYVHLEVGKPGILFLSEGPSVPPLNDPPTDTVSKFDLSTRKTEPYVGGVVAFTVSQNGEKALFRQ